MKTTFGQLDKQTDWSTGRQIVQLTKDRERPTDRLMDRWRARFMEGLTGRQTE